MSKQRKLQGWCWQPWAGAGPLPVRHDARWPPACHPCLPPSIHRCDPSPACSYAASFVFVEQLGGWRWMYGLAAAPAVVLAAGERVLAAVMVAARGAGLAANPSKQFGACATGGPGQQQHPLRLRRLLPSCSPWQRQPQATCLAMAHCTPPLNPAGMLWLPESPRWLLLSGAGPAAASAALRKAKGRTANEAVVQVGRRWCVCEGGGSQGLCSSCGPLPMAPAPVPLYCSSCTAG